MGKCTCEDWTIKEIADALQEAVKGDKKIVVPMFQRGKRWGRQQEKTFIDSLEKGYPVGTMLFYKQIESSLEKYILVDGLQRGNTIRKFIACPTNYFSNAEVSEEMCKELLSECDAKKQDVDGMRSYIFDVIKNHTSFSFQPADYFTIAQDIISSFEADPNKTKSVIERLTLFFEDKQKAIERISNSVVPVIVYQGKENTLPDIFDRINSKGTPLNQYEVYAASWPVDKRFKVYNNSIVDAVVNKYDSYVADGFVVDGYNSSKFRLNKELNAYEYVFGLGKYLSDKEEILRFYTTYEADTANPISFELLNACFNDSDKTDSLYEKILSVNVNELTNALFEAIKFVSECINPITKFKANKHNSKQEKRIYHSQYQIMSMISVSLRAMYEVGVYDKKKSSWEDDKEVLKKTLPSYYIYDIITNYWSDGGTKKIFRTDRYWSDIDGLSWSTALDGYFEKTLQRVEKSKVAPPSNEDYVFLNAIYLNIFSAIDQLSMDAFDVEHIAPKNQLIKLIQQTSSQGLPISCIANLCYLPDYVNRRKKDRNFYQDKKYLESIETGAMKMTLSEIEDKYSFTKVENLTWMDIPFTLEDAAVLKDQYISYCRQRYSILKEKFFVYLGIELDSLPSHSTTVEAFPTNSSNILLSKLESQFGCELEKRDNKHYISKTGSIGLCISLSKVYDRANSKLYWYGYKDDDVLSDCDEVYYVWGHKDDDDYLVIPENEMRNSLKSCLSTKDENGSILHWHIKYVWYPDGTVCQLESIPVNREKDVTKFKK